MSHELSERANGFVEMAYAGETPWHNLGQKVVKGAPIEEWQRSAGMDWAIGEAPVQFTYPVSLTLRCTGKVADKKVLYRSDSYAPLGVVGDGYKVVQPKDVLEFFRDLTQRAGFDIETAGTLFGGKRFWVLASIGQDCEIVTGDKVGGYLLLVTGADGTLATTGKFVMVRVVCDNTLSMAFGESGTEIKVSHKSLFKPDEMKMKLGLVTKRFNTFADYMRRLSDKKVSADRVERLAFDLLKPANFDVAFAAQGKTAIEKVSDSRAFKSILALFDGGGKGSDIDGVKGTAWGFVNAVSEYTDHAARAQSVDNRLNSAWFGAGDDLKNKAVELALNF